MKLHGSTSVLAGAVCLLAVPALAQPYGDGVGWQSGWSWGHMIFGMLMMILFWGGVIAAIVLLVRWLGAGSSAANPPNASRNPALEILRERFARGEIDREEFEDRKHLLSD